ncbi:uncharacterized TPR repeat-containing protein At1g05150 [Selaginella moellendorffii]|uniref:uncharacterized TPR repeat-containing protein At1g05150 n=1 Tax=Selaginella moellendorffii TaxID=88036 RepID=UPI000D1C9669|nr:uncharacterized TPR repeat-containing protein At1g05150 [Selaginella moellendorffii]XP_024519478.1 uncharacterized TPR repeat-containing protein At1g05150 [Selaginella moellendorffii]|eukprot:XP_024519477.1 uncharacterized TPR repeat-containing protein At1g05150 [Selaginella moellendorffii]
MPSSPNYSVRARKVEKIFKQFDGNGDGRLNRDEMAALVIAVNPRVKFSDEQIRAILDEVFRTYGEFIDGKKGLTFDGLLRTYDDGAGDVDRDFDALGLQLEKDDGAGAGTDVESVGDESRSSEPTGLSKAGGVVSIMDERPEAASAKRRQNVGAWAASPNNGIVYDDTWRLVEDLEILLRRAEAKIEARRKAKLSRKKSSSANGVDVSGQLAGGDEVVRRTMHDLGTESSVYQKALGDLRQKADASRTQDEAFDAHMAMGRSLFDHKFYEEALICFKRATELRPTDVRPHFRTGNTLYSLEKFLEAREAYELALDAANTGNPQWTNLVPQIHVNLGVALEGEGMLLNACEHYREAAILHPPHYRALKLLGSGLYGVGEYRAAEKALGEAIFLKSDYADAHCDLGSVLHALGDDERAIVEFQKAIDIKPDHMDALYNLGGLLRDTGRFQRAAEVYSRVLSLNPSHWQAQLNRAVSLLGAGDTEEARKALKEAFKMTNRVELYDAIGHLKHLQKKPKGLNGMIKGAQDVERSDSGFVIADPSTFTRVGNKTTPRPWIAHALKIRAFQKHTRLHRCNLASLSKEMANKPSVSQTAGTAGHISEALIRKADLEKSLSRMLSFLPPTTFQSAVKAINEKVLSVLDKVGSGRVDLGMFLATIAPLCAGPVDKRKRTAFDCLVHRSTKGLGAEIVKSDAKTYFKHLRAIYLSSESTSELWEVRGEDEHANISYPEFVEMFDDRDWAFGVLHTVVKLEAGDRVRHNGIACAVCSYPITGPRFKETNANFSLCSTCYGDGKVPDHPKQESYSFREYNSETDAVKDKLRFLGRS